MSQQEIPKSDAMDDLARGFSDFKLTESGQSSDTRDGPESAERLYELAVKFCSRSRSAEVTVLYRNETDAYFRNIKSGPGPHMMTVFPKEELRLVNRRSPIQNNISGLFFCVTLYKGALPTISPYGSKRVKIPLKDLFGDDKNLYFADFYCIERAKAKNPNHYVILILTRQKSTADNFCSGNLKKLDPNNNIFLRKEGGNFESTTAPHLWVEIIYTEDVDITDIEKEDVTATGSHSFIVKNTSCKICNY